MKIDSVNPGVKINRPAASGIRRTETPDETRPVARPDFKRIAPQNFEIHHTGDLRTLTPLNDDEKNYIALLFSTSETSFAGYDATRKRTDPGIPGKQLDIEI